MKKLGALGSVTVRLSTTPATPLAGTPPWPVTWSETVASGPRGPPVARLSSSRAGGSGSYMPLPSVADSGVVTQPATSKTASVEPVEPLKRLSVPSGPSGTSTRLGTDAPAVKLRLEASGRALPGYTVKNPLAVASVAVALSTTAVGGLGAFMAGTPPTPATCTRSVPMGPSLAVGAPRPVRVSRMRAGVMGR